MAVSAAEEQVCVDVQDAGMVGLRLLLPERVTAHHCGRIEVESEEGVGSLFRVLLPAGRI